MKTSAPRGAWLTKAILYTSSIGSSCVIAGIFFDTYSVFSHFICYFLAYAVFAYLITLTNTFKRLSWTPTRWRNFLLITAIAQALVLLSLFIPADDADLESPQHFSIIWMNLHFEEEAINELAQLVAKRNPDIVVIAEAYSKDLSDKFGAYSFVFHDIKDSLYLYSKHPLTNPSVVPNGDDRSFLMVDVGIARRRFRLITTHLSWPIFDTHQASLQKAGELAKTFDNVIIAGDFNSAAWAAPFRNMLAENDLQHARQGYGLMNSWHADRYKMLGLQLDHFVYKGKINNTAFEVLKTEHSDHYAISAEFDLGGKFLRKLRN
ncbi:MAG: endonuclease/exonuclease/phosphatase (EEP) superfamily protein YafD [Myxococcota bacterium]|jgi:endonuclease/exonuclease/phosphatase (EEP) superfamily protein YafD